MGVLTHSIGIFAFDDMQGTIEPSVQMLELFSRPGRNGTQARETGVKAPPTTVRTIHYIDNWNTTLISMTGYIALIGAAPVTVIKNSVGYGTMLVVNVREVPNETRAVFNVIGAIGGPDKQVRHVVDWTLQYLV